MPSSSSPSSSPLLLLLLLAAISAHQSTQTERSRPPPPVSLRASSSALRLGTHTLASFLEAASGDPGTPGWAMYTKEFKLPWWCTPYMPPDVGGRGVDMEDGLWISHGCVNCPRSQLAGNMPRNPVLDMPMPVTQIATGKVTLDKGSPMGRISMWDKAAAGYFNFKAVSETLVPARRARRGGGRAGGQRHAALPPCPSSYGELLEAVLLELGTSKTKTVAKMAMTMTRGGPVESTFTKVDVATYRKVEATVKRGIARRAYFKAHPTASEKEFAKYMAEGSARARGERAPSKNTTLCDRHLSTIEKVILGEPSPLSGSAPSSSSSAPRRRLLDANTNAVASKGAKKGGKDSSDRVHRDATTRSTEGAAHASPPNG